ncbi:hypothetical protein ACROYT_G023098 [Oculina patagonica]
MAKLQATVALVGILFIASLLVDQTTCFITENSKRDIEMVRTTRQICAAARSLDCGRELKETEDHVMEERSLIKEKSYNE